MTTEHRIITVGEWTFDHIRYDADADVLYLSIGAPRRSVAEETPEGHLLRFDEVTGEFCGLTLINIRSLWQQNGETPAVTLPRRELIERDELEPVLA